MILSKRRIGKLLAVMISASLCSAMSVTAAYAAEPSGPASDTAIALNYKQEATGPGAVQPQEEPAGQNEEAESAGQPAEEQKDQTVTEEAGESSTEGMVSSGGRWIDPSKPMIALTFDDGPYAPVGDRIMDVLEQYNGRSTFFVVGNRVATYRSEVSRMQANGHEVANHTYEHKNLTKLGAAQIQSQIEKCNAAVAAVTGVSPALVRLPGGSKNGTVLANVHYPVIMWNVDTLDWKTRNAQKTIDSVIGKVQDGDIVLMHELYASTADAVDVIVPALVEQGYQLVTVSELASFRGGVAAGGVYSRMRP